MNTPLERLRHHVTGAIERGEATAIAGRHAAAHTFTFTDREWATIDAALCCFAAGIQLEELRPIDRKLAEEDIRICARLGERIGKRNLSCTCDGWIAPASHAAWCERA